MGNPLAAIGAIPVIGDIATPVVAITTAGTVDLEKGRINVPGSGAQMRGLAKGATLGLANDLIDSRTGRLAGDLAATAVLTAGSAGIAGPLAAGANLGGLSSFLTPGVSAALGATLSTQLWNQPPSLASTLGFGAVAVGAAIGVPALGDFFQSSPGSGYPVSSRYLNAPVAVPVPWLGEDGEGAALPAGKATGWLVIAAAGVVILIIARR